MQEKHPSIKILHADKSASRYSRGEFLSAIPDLVMYGKKKSGADVSIWSMTFWICATHFTK
ncbi:MAG: hypothetical protein ACRD52_10450, partial [Candidatus Acidiferrales bacterium]